MCLAFWAKFCINWSFFILHTKKEEGKERHCDITENMWCHLTATVGRWFPPFCPWPIVALSLFFCYHIRCGNSKWESPDEDVALSLSCIENSIQVQPFGVRGFMQCYLLHFKDSICPFSNEGQVLSLHSNFGRMTRFSIESFFSKGLVHHKTMLYAL